MITTENFATGLLKLAFGPNAEYREGQWEAIQAVQSEGSRLLVVQRTGWGKSIVYFVATAMNRKAGRGITLLLSPLLALMRNQIEMANKFGLRAATINSTNSEEWDQIVDLLDRKEIDVLFVSPERLANQQFQTVLNSILDQIGLLVIDEAHCISDWGHDFRPDYRRILQLVQRMPATSSILATTATATDKVIKDVIAQLGDDMVVQRGTVLRESLKLSAFELPSHAERLAWLEKFLPRFLGSGIVYTLTVHDADQVAEYLKSCGIQAAAYHSIVPHEKRLEIESQFGDNQLKVVVATSALGMGYDKSDVGFVVHYQLPPSILAFYQQIGRAGRMLDLAFACLLFSEGDQEIAEHFAMTSIPPMRVFEHILSNVSHELQSPAELGKGLKVSASLLYQALSILEVDESIERKRTGGFELPEKPKRFDIDRYLALQKKRLDDSDEMLDFARTQKCRMQLVGEALGDSTIKPCGRCDNCQPRAPLSLDPARVRAADLFLISARFSIEPRSMLPAVGPDERGKKIPEGLRLEAGLALSIYNDSGYGRMVKQAKYRGEPFQQELVDAAAEAIRDCKLGPEWVAAVPSQVKRFVPEFARLLAAKLEIPFLDCVSKSAENLPQKAMLHTHAQFANVKDVFEISDVLPGKCLLVDDIVDSGWTLTVIGMALREKGSGSVIPFALATAKPRSQN